MVIRAARAEELDALWRQVRSAVAFMNDLGNPQWNESYPTPEHFSAAREAGTLFVAVEEGEILGGVILDETQAPEYGPLPWTTPERALVIHKLALGQESMGRGVAAKLLHYAAATAQARGLTALRVDTYHKNRPMQRLLAKEGFSFVGAIHFSGQQPGEYLCFEKQISGANV